MVIMFVPLSTRAEQSNGLIYEYDEYSDGIYITGYTGTAAQLDIPATIDGKKVTTIDDSVFENCKSLVDVTISADLDYIGSNVFSGCSNLKSVIFTGKMLGNMEYGAFSNCNNLEKVVLPECITSIDSDVFFECENLKYVYIPDSVTNIDQEYLYLLRMLLFNARRDLQRISMRSDMISSAVTVMAARPILQVRIPRRMSME